MAQNRIRAAVGPSEEHLWRAPLGRCKRRIPILHVLLLYYGVPSLWAPVLCWVCYPRGGYDFLLGQRAVVNGEPVQLGQTSWTVRNLHQFSGAHHSHPSRNVARRDLRHGPVRSTSGTPRLDYFRTTHSSFLASRYPRLLSDPCISLRDGHGLVLSLLSIW